MKLITILLFLTLSSFHIKDSQGSFENDPGHENNFARFLVAHAPDEEVKEFSQVLKDRQKLYLNDLDWNRFPAFTAALADNKTLESLNICHSRFNDNLLKILSIAFETNDTLNNFTLINYQNANQFTNEGLIILTKALQKNGKLRLLIINNNSQIKIDGIQGITNLVLNNYNLKSLELTDCSLDHLTLNPLINVLKKKCCLERLNLSDNNLGDEGALLLVESLKTNTSVISLHLNNNHITDEGAIAFSEFLKINIYLQSLDLGKNLLTNKGAIALAHSLLQNAILRYLNISFNKIQEEGGIAFIKVIENNWGLRRLALGGGNEISHNVNSFICNNLRQRSREIVVKNNII